jgi:hypothetical protein
MTTRSCKHDVYVPDAERVRNRAERIANCQNQIVEAMLDCPSPRDLKALRDFKETIDPVNGVAYCADGTAFVDDILLANVVYEGEKYAVNANYALMSAAIASIVEPVGMGSNWKFHEVEYEDDVQLDQNTQDHVDAARATAKCIRKNTEQVELQKLVNESVNNNFDQIEMANDAKVVLTPAELKMRTICDLVATACGVDGVLSDVVKYVANNDLSVARAKKMVSIRNSLEAIGDRTRMYHKQYAALSKAFEIGRSYTTAEKDRIVFEIFKESVRGVSDRLSSQAMTDLLTNVFDTTTKTVKINGKAAKVIVINSINRLPELEVAEQAVLV